MLPVTGHLAAQPATLTTRTDTELTATRRARPPGAKATTKVTRRARPLDPPTATTTLRSNTGGGARQRTRSARRATTRGRHRLNSEHRTTRRTTLRPPPSAGAAALTWRTARTGPKRPQTATQKTRTPNLNAVQTATVTLTQRQRPPNVRRRR